MPQSDIALCIIFAQTTRLEFKFAAKLIQPLYYDLKQ